MFKDKSDIELLDMYSTSHDQKCLSELFLRHSDMAYRTSKRITKNSADAEDIVQISFIEVIKTHQKFRQEGSFLSWFLKIVSHRSLDRLRSDKRRSSRESQAIKADYYEDKKLENDEKQKQVIESYLSLLPPRYREPIYMKVVEGLSTKEVSKILAKPEKTIRTQISRGLERIKESIKTSGITLSVLMITNLLNNLSLEAAPVSLTNQASINYMTSQIEMGNTSTLFSMKSFMALASVVALATMGYFYFEKSEFLESFRPVNMETAIITSSEEPITTSKPKSFFENFDGTDSLSRFKLLLGKVIRKKDVGVEKSYGIELEPFTVLSLDISQYKLPLKITYDYDMYIPKLGKIKGPSFDIYQQDDPDAMVYLFYKFKDALKVNYAPNLRFSEAKKRWMKKVVYLFDDHIETWIDGKRSHVIFLKSSSTFILSHSSEAFIDNISINEIKMSDLKRDKIKVDAIRSLYLEAKRDKLKKGHFDIITPTVKKLFHKPIKLNTFDYKIFMKSFKDHQVSGI